MGKNKGFDIIAEAHERANHNFHQAYWFNRVTPFTIAQWKANKYFAPIFFVLYTTSGVIWLYSLHEAALAANKSFWAVLFDVSNASAASQFASFLILFILWAIVGIATVQNILQRTHASPPASPPERRKEKKKKYPKRPKNYR